MIGKLNHVGVATPSIEESWKLYRDVLGCTDITEEARLPEQGVWVSFVNLPNAQIELIEPYGEASPIHGFLAKNPKGGQHHVCFEVPDILAARDEMRAKGATVLGTGEPRIGAHGVPVIFVHPKDMGGVLVELMQNPDEATDGTGHLDRGLPDHLVGGAVLPILPIGVISHAEAGIDKGDGGDPGAPVDPKLKRKFITTTWVSAMVFTPFWLAMHFHLHPPAAPARLMTADLRPRRAVQRLGAVDRRPLSARQAQERRRGADLDHLLHRHHAGGGGADHRHVGDERLPHRAAGPHPRLQRPCLRHRPDARTTPARDPGAAAHPGHSRRGPGHPDGRGPGAGAGPRRDRRRRGARHLAGRPARHQDHRRQHQARLAARASATATTAAT